MPIGNVQSFVHAFSIGMNITMLIEYAFQFYIEHAKHALNNLILCVTIGPIIITILEQFSIRIAVIEVSSYSFTIYAYVCVLI